MTQGRTGERTKLLGLPGIGNNRIYIRLAGIAHTIFSLPYTPPLLGKGDPTTHQNPRFDCAYLSPHNHACTHCALWVVTPPSLNVMWLLRPIGDGVLWWAFLWGLYVCPRAYLRNHASNLHHIFYACRCGRGWVLLWERSDTLCTFGFAYDVIVFCAVSQLPKLIST